MTEDEKQIVARNFITGLSSGDRSLLSDTLTEDVVWSIPGATIMSGEAHGVDAILARSANFKRFNVTIQIEHVVYGLKDVALHLHNTGTHEGNVLDERLTTVCRLRGKKIERLDTFITDVPMLNAYFPAAA
jgi:ketosteroid isomerase-like protein